MKAFVTSLLCVVAVSASLSQALEVREAYVRGLPPTQKNTAAFFELVNDSGQDIVLSAGSSAAAEQLQIHGHSQQNGMMSMRELPSVTLAPGETLRFAPGGLHLMLINLRAPLRDGDQVEFSLRDAQGQEWPVSAPVVSVLKGNAAQSAKRGGESSQMDHQHHH